MQNQPELIDYALVPGLAFDKEGIRLGRGGGRYDRFLSNHPETTTIGLCRHEQVLKTGTIPVDTRDRAMDYVVPLSLIE